MMWALAALVLVLVGCSDHEPPKPRSDPPPARAIDASPRPAIDASPRPAIDAAPSAEPGIPISVDGTRVASVPRARLSQPVELSELIDVPPENWKLAEGYVSAHKSLKLRRPQETYPDHKVMVFSDDNGAPCFGTFLREDKAPANMRHLLGKPRLFVRGIVDIRIRTREEPVEVEAPVSLEIAVGDSVTTLDTKRLDKLAGAQTGIGDRARPTWNVRDLVRSVHKGRIRSLVATGQGELEISGDALSSDKHKITIRLNRRGQLKLEWIDSTKQRAVTAGELRAVTRITVTP